VPNAGYVYVATRGGVVYVIDPSSHSVVGGITIGFTLNDIAVSPTGSKAGYVYVTDTDDDTVFVISPYDAQNPSTISGVSVGNGPGSLAISPTGANAGNVYVANELSSTVSVIDPSNNVSTIFLGNGGDSTVAPGYAFAPKVVAVSPTGANAGYVYVGGYQGDIAVINPSGTYVGNIGGSFGYDPGGLAVGPNGDNAGNNYLASASERTLTVLSPAGAILESISVGVWSSGIAIAP
jgi:YVTN family beta-propeller protein